MTIVNAITAAEIKQRKAALESTLAALSGSAPERDQLQIEHLADPIDQVRFNLDRDLIVQRLDHQTHKIREIQSALAKIEAGDYGLCEDCERPIPRKRLEVVPWARLCVSCQSKREVTDRVFEDAA